MTHPIRQVRLGPADVLVERREGGVILMRSPHPLGEYPAKLTEPFEYWAARAPDRVLFAQRDDTGGWRSVTYSEALDRARRIGQALLARDLSSERPIVVLSGNDIEHALLELAALYVGIPYAPVSPAYSLISSDFGKLRQIVNLLTPGLVFAADGEPYRKAIEAVVRPEIEVVLTRHPFPGRRVTSFSDLSADAPGPVVDAAHAALGPDTIAKFLFTSGSTGAPKGVINTQRMWCANQVMIRSAMAYFADEPPVIVDWAPWHHTAGGNHNFGLALFNGGSFYIDEGKPLPGAIETTVRNLREVAPSWYFNVPKGFEALLPYLRAEAALRENFFSRLKVLWFAGAGVAQHVFDEIKDLSYRTCGESVLFLTGFGSTETGPATLARVWETDNAANMGLPLSGAELKLVPVAGKLEMRVKGPHITPGYWRAPQLDAQAFDEEGYYRIGDAFTLADPADPVKGLLFAGRIAEDFKLGTGTWVHVGGLRNRFIEHFAPFARDVVFAGAARDEVAALVFPDIDACRRLALDLPANAPASAVLGDARVRKEFEFLLEALARQATGSSNRVVRAILLEEPPSLDAGEMTDKGSINQGAVLGRRAALVEELYANPPAPGVIRADTNSHRSERS